ILLLVVHFSNEVVGWFGLTQTAVRVPVTLISQAVAQVYLGELSKRLRAQGTGSMLLFNRVSKALAACAVAVFAALVGLAPIIFPIIFGTNWYNSGIYAAALAPGLA